MRVLLDFYKSFKKGWFRLLKKGYKKNSLGKKGKRSLSLISNNRIPILLLLAVASVERISELSKLSLVRVRLLLSPENVIRYDSVAFR